MEQLLRQWDGESVTIHMDRPTGAWMIVAIHSTVLGPGTGGTRMKSYPGLKAAVADALRLSASMTFKYAVVDFPRGGAKAVIALPDEFDPALRFDLLRRYGELVQQFGGRFQTGPDVGTSSTDMDTVAETGAPHVFCCTPEKGGAGDSGPPTAIGVFSGICTACERLFGDSSPASKRVLVQGAGSVGGRLIKLLKQAGAEVLFSDVDPQVTAHFREEMGLEFVDPEAVFDCPCDIFSPCALGGVLNRETIPRLKCLAVAGAANNQLAEPADAQRLWGRQVLYAPDYAVNIGGAVAIVGMEAMGWSRQQAEEKVREKVRNSLRRIFESSAAEGIDTESAARRIAANNLDRAAKRKRNNRGVPR